MVTTPSAPKQWVHCTAIPVSYYTYYGPGELETFRHMQLHAEVKLAKLKIWYPGVWHRPSPRALFRMHINNPARNGTDDLVLLHFLSNSNIIVATCQYSKGQCRESRKIRWKSTTMNIGTLQGENEKLYKHNLLYFANSEEDESSGEVNKDFLMDSDAEDCSNFCVTMELDSRGEDYSASRELSSDEECSVSHLYAPPCISLLRPDESTICKVEWRPVLRYESTRSQGAAEMNRIQNVSSTTRYDYHHAPSNEDKEKSLWLFPHQVDLRKVTTVHPTYIERNKTQTSKYNEIICDFGRELLGHVKINNLASSSSSSSSHTSSSFVGQTIQLRVGETLPEALNDNEEHFEQSVDLCANIDEDGTVLWWSSSHLVAFRFVRVIIASDDIDLDKLSVACLSSEPELNNLGSLDFGSNVSDDNLLDKKIWDCSLKTLKLCIHRNFIVDGIKRDRLPWLGDVIVSLLANAYSYHDEECIRWTLSVLGRCGMEKLYSNSNSSADDVDTARINVAESHVNGILDYSLWLFICHWLYQRYFGDVIFLRQEWPLLETRLMNLVTWCSDKENGWFIEHKNEWVFIDWTVEGEKSVPLQIVWWWALDCASNLAESILLAADVDKSKDDVEKKAHDEAERVIASIQDVQAKLETSLLESDDIQKGYKRHAHLLGVLSGLYSRLDERASGDWWNPDTSDERVHITKKCRKLIEGSREALLGKDLASVATPYMKNLECMALIRLGERRAAIEKVRAYWGGMLRTDATTFYEAFNEKETATDVAAFYERPFARSLCHAWSAGPCALYQEILLGIRPLSNGWKEWSCSPLDDVVTVSASIKTVFGKIEVSLDPTQLRVRVPDRTTMKLMNKSYGGGMHCIPRSVLISSESVRAWSKKYRDWHYHDEHVIPPNPIIGGHEGIQMTDVPTVFQLPGDAEKFYMSFVGFDGVGYQTFIAESTNLVQWRNLKLAMGYGEEGAFDHGGVVLGAYLYESYSIDAPRILKMVDDNFISLYGAYKKKNQYEADPGFQGLAVSLNGLYWKRGHDESILSIYGRPGEIKDWEKDSIYQPWLIEHNGMYYNFYNAKQMPAWIEQIGIATSLNLLQWERHTDNPIICVCKDGFDTQFCSDPKVFWDEKENHWVMFFYGVGRGAAHIMIAFSRDLHHWERDKTPLYQAGGNPSGIDNRYAHKVSIVFNHSNETFYMFYCAVGDGGRGIGLITSKPLRGC